MDVDCANHFGALQIPNPQGDSADCMASNKFHYLSGGGKFGINLEHN